MVAFANSEGGKIFMGVSDKGEIKGSEISNRVRSQIQDLANNCDPSIIIDLEEINNILIVDVKEGRNKPYKCSDGFFVRVGSNSQKMKRDEIVQMILSLGNKKFDEIITNVKEFDEEVVKSYLKKAGINSLADKNALFSFGVADDKGNLNNSGVLFFTKNPKRYLINAYVTCARYNGIDKVEVIDRKDFEEDLVTQIEQAVEFVKRNTKLSYEIKGLVRRDIPEYPIEAIREAILNAVMHRDYFEKGANVQIDIFDDRLIVTNIGGLIKPLTKEKLGTIAVRRNPLIADLFNRIHFVEKMGTGIKRIKEVCKQHGNVKFRAETNGYFIAEFKLIKLTPQVTPQVELTELEKKIFAEIKDNPKISRKELSIRLKIGEDTIKEYLDKLKDKKMIKRIGETSAGYWEIISERKDK